MRLSNYCGIGILIILLTAILNSCTTSVFIQIYPENNSVIIERQPTFKWIGKADKLILDDNDEFVSPIIENVKSNSYQIKDKLNFTTYYWKLIGEKESSVLQFKIESVVAMELKNQNELYNLTNIGNADLDVEVVDENNSIWKITGNLILRLNETKQFNVNNKKIFVGKQR